jgi:sec-independent protein translocase protein TatB
MFDLGFSELLLVAVVALVVLGPERLPKATRFAGLWVRRARAQWHSVKSELERELAAEELKRDLRDTRAALRDIDAGVRAAGDEVRRDFETTRDEAFDGIVPRPTPPVAVTPTDGRDAPSGTDDSTGGATGASTLDPGADGDRR